MQQRINYIHTNFTAGELSPTLMGRVDFKKYFTGCETLQNFIIQPQGGVVRRGGTEFIAEVKTSAQQVRLIPFIFSQDQAYILEFGPQYIRFYTEGGQITVSGVPYEITTPFSETEVQELTYAQSQDVLYLAHRSHQPYKLIRRDHTDWVLLNNYFQYYPTIPDEQKLSGTLTPGAKTGTNILFTCSSSVFLDGDVGREIKCPDQSARAKIVTYVSSTQVRGDIIDDFESTDPISSGSWYLTGLTDTHLTIPAWKNPGTSNATAIYYQGQEVNLTTDKDFFRTNDVSKILRIFGGVLQITAYSSPTTATARIIKELAVRPHESAGHKHETAYFCLEIPAWDDNRGWPGVVTFFENRLVYASTNTYPQAIWASQSGNFEDFCLGSSDADAWAFTLAADQLHQILWATPSRKLFLGTTDGEWCLYGSTSTGAITPTNVVARGENSYGVEAVRPIAMAMHVIYVQKNAKKLRQLSYNFETDSFQSDDLSILSEHILAAGVRDMAFALDPDSIVWICDQDGNLIGLTHQRQHEVVGWHRHPMTNAAVENMAVIPYDGISELWLVVRRTINGATVRYVERLRHYDYETLPGAWFLDCALQYNGPEATTITGLDHLEGQTVGVLVDGNTHPDETVTGGSITLERPGSIVLVGLPYESKLRTVRPEIQLQGTLQSRPKRLVSATLRLLKTVGGSHGPDDDHMTSLPVWNTETELGECPEPYSGDVRITVPSGYDTQPVIQLSQSNPHPMQVLAIILEMVVSP